MNRERIAKAIDHAILKPDADERQLADGCGTAAKYQVASVCVKPCHVVGAVKLLENSGVVVSTVIGFPHGGTTMKVKMVEAEEAIQNGAKELDMVINIGMLKSGNEDYVRSEIGEICKIAHGNGVLVKVILETALLSTREKEKVCQLSLAAGADFVKTSTGFNGQGATMEDVLLMQRCVGETMGVKASGGIRDHKDAIGFMEAGCTRLGTSNTQFILDGLADGNQKSEGGKKPEDY